MIARRASVLALSLTAGVVCSAAQRPGDQGKPVPPPSIAPLDLPRLLDTYAAGRFDEAVQAIARAGDEVGRNLRHHWPLGGLAWIEAVPERRTRRLLAAAALALENETIRIERGDWRNAGKPPCAAACALDWAQRRPGRTRGSRCRRAHLVPRGGRARRRCA
jgi:hypothetical protein